MKPLLICVSLACLVSCGHHDERNTAPPVSETKKGSVAKAEMLQASVKMAAGELHILSGEPDEVKAEFHYTPGAIVPSFKLDTTSFRARAIIEQNKGELDTFGFKDNKWYVYLPTRPSTDLDINMGAGEARLKLGAIPLRKVDLHIGAGEVHADFTGEPKRDFEIDIRGGVGECRVVLPRSARIRAEAHGGLGSIEVTGLTKHGDIWESDNLSSNAPRIRLDVHGGIGSIHISTQ